VDEVELAVDPHRAAIPHARPLHGESPSDPVEGARRGLGDERPFTLTGGHEADNVPAIPVVEAAHSHVDVRESEARCHLDVDERVRMSGSPQFQLKGVPALHFGWIGHIG
jgi:hypothetical protein